ASYMDGKWPEALKESGAWPLSGLRQSFLNGSFTRLLDPDATLKAKITEFVSKGISVWPHQLNPTESMVRRISFTRRDHVRRQCIPGNKSEGEGTEKGCSVSADPRSGVRRADCHQFARGGSSTDRRRHRVGNKSSPHYRQRAVGDVESYWNQTASK